jgi:hypothetical protein
MPHRNASFLQLPVVLQLPVFLQLRLPFSIAGVFATAGVRAAPRNGIALMARKPRS